MKVLVTGCPRSGTTFVSRLLCTKYGLDMPHEKMGEHGTVSYAFAVDAEEYLWCHEGERRRDFDFDLIFHLVRDPLACIGSLTVMMHMLSPFFEAHLGELRGASEIQQCADVWIRWNKLVERQAHFRVRVEDIPTRGIGTAINSRMHHTPTYGELGALREEVFELAVRYGYGI